MHTARGADGSAQTALYNVCAGTNPANETSAPWCLGSRRAVAWFIRTARDAGVVWWSQRPG
jgi:hypothetical protein